MTSSKGTICIISTKLGYRELCWEANIEVYSSTVEENLFVISKIFLFAFIHNISHVRQDTGLLAVTLVLNVRKSVWLSSFHVNSAVVADVRLATFVAANRIVLALVSSCNSYVFVTWTRQGHDVIDAGYSWVCVEVVCWMGQLKWQKCHVIFYCKNKKRIPKKKNTLTAMPLRCSFY